MTIQNLYPKARPRSIYNTINGRPEIPAASTFSRASEASYVDSTGMLHTAAVDEPRFNYDPETGEFLGLMLEPESTNYLTYSEEINNNDWSKTGGSSVTADQEIAPDGTNTADLWTCNQAGARLTQTHTKSDGVYSYSFFAKAKVNFEFRTHILPRNPTIGGNVLIVYWDLSDGTFTTNSSTYAVGTPSILRLNNGWFKCSFTYRKAGGAGNLEFRVDAMSDTDEFYLWGFQGEETFGSSYIKTLASAVTRSPDTFSLTTLGNFNNGFSLLIDSETSTEDFIYKIKENGNQIAILDNANGTLDWVITAPDGTPQSAALDGQYPQIGAIQPGRVRTISSYGAADGTTQLNYLYTKGLSFPTNAIVSSDADEVEFGPGQTLKAVYLWDGQLRDSEAVSVIKGQYNVVTNDPISGTSYSFVYNTDPTNIGEDSITLPYIIPTVSMVVNWGDTKSDAYSQGVTPSHTYPYPGQYRIQIEADDEFDAVRLGDVEDAITRVDQWAPQHRVGASGPGFTGDDLVSILEDQNAKFIPPYKYTNITNMAGAFKNNRYAAVNNWDYVAVNLPQCGSLSSTYAQASRYSATTAEKAAFPQLQTSSNLTDISSIFSTVGLSGFVDQNNISTNKPLTNTTNVTDLTYAFYDNKLTDIDIDLQSCETIKGAFYNNDFVTFPNLGLGNIQDFESAFKQNQLMTTFVPADLSNGTNFTSAWQDCSALTTLPSNMDVSSGVNFNNAWNGCTALTSFPNNLDFGQADSLDSTWSNCVFTSFHAYDFPDATSLARAWRQCQSMTSFGKITIPNVTNLNYSWEENAFTAFPDIDVSSVENFSYAWSKCSNLVNFGPDDFSNATNMRNAWFNCSSLIQCPNIITANNVTTYQQMFNGCTSLTTVLPGVFNSMGTLVSDAFDDTFKNCALDKDSIENIFASLVQNGAQNITLGIGGGTNSPRYAGTSGTSSDSTSWSSIAEGHFNTLLTRGWTITFNKYANSEDTQP